MEGEYISTSLIPKSFLNPRYGELLIMKQVLYLMEEINRILVVKSLGFSPDRLYLFELGFPVSENVGLYSYDLAYFSYLKIKLVRQRQI